jgi:hypothetical protein
MFVAGPAVRFLKLVGRLKTVKYYRKFKSNQNLQKPLKKFLRWVLFNLGILTLTAFTSLMWYDYKENKWYHGPVSISRAKQNDTTTVVCILATVHQPNPNYNSDSIVAILNLFQPDLMLTEEDSLIFEVYHKDYKHTLQKPLFARLGRSFGFGSAEEIEGRAVRKYKIGHPTVDIRPFDYEGRNAFYATPSLKKMKSVENLNI